MLISSHSFPTHRLPRPMKEDGREHIKRKRWEESTQVKAWLHRAIDRHQVTHISTQRLAQNIHSPRCPLIKRSPCLEGKAFQKWVYGQRNISGDFPHSSKERWRLKESSVRVTAIAVLFSAQNIRHQVLSDEGLLLTKCVALLKILSRSVKRD